MTEPIRVDKVIRSRVIADYVAASGFRGVVCFSCGHASAALKALGLYVVDVSPSGDLVPARWWTQAEIHRAWPDLFDATCGHLPLTLLANVAAVIRDRYADRIRHGLTYEVATGSGESLLCLRLAFPASTFTPRWGLDAATSWHPESPLASVLSGMSA